MTQENPIPEPDQPPGSEPSIADSKRVDKPTLIARTFRRIVAEALFVALLGALVFGVSAEMHMLNVGFFIAVAIWIAGTPALEVIRVLQSRR